MNLFERAQPAVDELCLRLPTMDGFLEGGFDQGGEGFALAKDALGSEAPFRFDSQPREGNNPPIQWSFMAEQPQSQRDPDINGRASADIARPRARSAAVPRPRCGSSTMLRIEDFTSF